MDRYIEKLDIKYFLEDKNKDYTTKLKKLPRKLRQIIYKELKDTSFIDICLRDFILEKSEVGESELICEYPGDYKAISIDNWYFILSERNYIMGIYDNIDDLW